MDEYLVDEDDILEIYTDGASRSNPGPSSYAFIFKLRGEGIPFFEKSEFIGNSTNNIAEYKAILNALKEAKNIRSGAVTVYSDSQLAVKQLSLDWKINKTHLRALANDIWTQMKQFTSIKFIHVKRTNKYVKICDRLCNESLDENL